MPVKEMIMYVSIGFNIGLLIALWKIVKEYNNV